MQRRLHLAIASTLIGLAVAPPSIAQSPPPPMAGYVCADFATRSEAQWHYLQGTAPAELDADSDGKACEELSDEARKDGRLIARNTFTNRTSYALWYSPTVGDYYLKISGHGEPFTTRSFASSAEAFTHANCYYGNSCSIRR